jgi:hypothetical protein
MFYLNDFISYYEYLLHLSIYNLINCCSNLNATKIKMSPNFGTYFLSSKAIIVQLYTKELRKLSTSQLFPTLLSHPPIFNFTFFLPSQYLKIYHVKYFCPIKNNFNNFSHNSSFMLFSWPLHTISTLFHN